MNISASSGGYCAVCWETATDTTKPDWPQQMAICFLFALAPGSVSLASVGLFGTDPTKLHRISFS